MSNNHTEKDKEKLAINLANQFAATHNTVKSLKRWYLKELMDGDDTKFQELLKVYRDDIIRNGKQKLIPPKRQIKTNIVKKILNESGE